MITKGVLINILVTIPANYITFWGLSRMIRLRKPRLYRLFWLGMMTLGNVVLFGLLRLTTVNSILTILIYAFSLFPFSDESALRKLMAGGFMLLLIYITDGFSAALFLRIGGRIHGWGNLTVTETPGAYLLANVFALSLYLMLQQVLIYLWNRVANRSQERFLWYFSLFPLSQGLLFVLADRFAATSTTGQETAMLLLSAASVLCIGADFALFRAIAQLTRRENAEQRAAFLEAQLDGQRTQYEQILSDAEEASRIRHDIRNQLQTAFALLDAGESARARTQLGDVGAILDAHAHYCENAVVNAVLDAKVRVCRKSGIEVQADCPVPEELPVSGAELCSIFSNLLDNAAAACEKLPEEARRIRLAAAVRGGYLIVRCENPDPAEPEARPQRRTTDRHGWGLEILTGIAARHGGRVESGRENGAYRTAVFLELPESPAAGGAPQPAGQPEPARTLPRS